MLASAEMTAKNDRDRGEPDAHRVRALRYDETGDDAPLVVTAVSKGDLARQIVEAARVRHSRAPRRALALAFLELVPGDRIPRKRALRSGGDHAGMVSRIEALRGWAFDRARRLCRSLSHHPAAGARRKASPRTRRTAWARVSFLRRRLARARRDLRGARRPVGRRGGARNAKRADAGIEPPAALLVRDHAALTKRWIASSICPRERRHRAPISEHRARHVAQETLGKYR